MTDDRDLVTRLREYRMDVDSPDVVSEAADEIELLREALVDAWDEGEAAGRHNEHEYRPNRLMKNPYRQEEQT
jgi:hypothetical protein